MLSKSNKNLYHLFRYKAFIIPSALKKQKKRISRIRNNGRARVAFIVSSLSMWRLERVYRLMEADPVRFEPAIILIPFKTVCREDKENEMRMAREHFSKARIPVLGEEDFAGFDPDIVFYPQFYRRPYKKGLNPSDNEDRLLCYSPYGIMLIDKPWQYNLRFHNVAWKLFIQSEHQRQTAKILAFNKGVNTVIAGDADYDDFAQSSFKDVWKPQEKAKKRIIWAPHHSFGKADMLGRDSFLWTAEEMTRIAQEYSDSVQFSFKPHPRLYSELCRHEDWGEERTRAFYDLWENGANTQIDDAGFVDLFKGSDAMIHDCNSFIAEYMYTCKPVLFLSRNMDRVRAGLNRIGNKALDASYTGDSPESIREFIDRILTDGDDPKKPLREAFKKDFLSPADPEGFAEGVVRDIRRSLWG